MIVINIARDYSNVPGPRLEQEGPHSGEGFREKILLPKLLEAEQAGEAVRVELDGVRFGYPTSFLEEAFGGLARKLGIARVLKHLELVSLSEPPLVDEIRHYIRSANQTSSERLAQG